MTIGSWIREVRLEAGLSQNDLAYATHISVRQIQGYEYGDHSPSADKLAKIAEACGVEMPWSDKTRVYLHGTFATLLEAVS